MLGIVHEPAYVARFGGFGSTVASGIRGLHRWRVRAIATTSPFGAATAVGIARLAAHRYAGVRVDMRLEPTCPSSSARSAALVPALTRLVRDAHLNAHLLPSH